MTFKNIITSKNNTFFSLVRVYVLRFRICFKDRFKSPTDKKVNPFLVEISMWDVEWKENEDIRDLRISKNSSSRCV
jgi:hypothetical protein